MATVALPEPQTAPASDLTLSPERLYRLTVTDYLRMIEAGIVKNPHRVFLWKGLIVTKMTKARPHTVTLLRLQEALKPLISHVGYLEAEQPVRLLRRGDTLPEPDVKVVRGRLEDYADIPTTAHVPLVIEVADSSLAEDRRDSLPLYGAEGIPHFWIAHIPQRRFEVYSGPADGKSPPGYKSLAIYEKGQAVPVVIDGVEVGRIAVSDIFQEDDPWLL